MLTKSTFSCVFIVVLSLFVRLSQQNLNKRPLLEGLNNFNYGYLKTPPYTSTPGGNAGLCHCNGAAPQSVHTITYHETGNHQLVLCMCPNAVMSAQYMIEMMGRVPYVIRRYNKAMISATSGTCGGAGSSGDVSFYCHPNMHVSVFIHESAHSTDRGTSGANEWRNAVQQDSCVPDPYANTNFADNFAQVAVLWTHLVGQGLHSTLGGSQFSCMRNQLQQISKIFPALSIQKSGADGDCVGSRCGCYKGYCWAYVDAAYINTGDWWCYTQKEGVYGKQGLWHTCAKDSDCSWDRSCGSCRQYKRFEETFRDVC